MLPSSHLRAHYSIFEGGGWLTGVNQDSVYQASKKSNEITEQSFGNHNFLMSNMSKSSTCCVSRKYSRTSVQKNENGSGSSGGDEHSQRPSIWPYLVIRQTHVFIGLLQLPRYLQLQPPLLQFTLLVQPLLISFLLPQALALLDRPKKTPDSVRAGRQRPRACVCVCAFISAQGQSGRFT